MSVRAVAHRRESISYLTLGQVTRLIPPDLYRPETPVGRNYGDLAGPAPTIARNGDAPPSSSDMPVGVVPFAPQRVNSILLG